MDDIPSTVGHDAWELSRAIMQILCRRMDPSVLDEVVGEIEARAAVAEAKEWPQYAAGMRLLAADLSASIVTAPAGAEDPRGYRE